MKQSLRRLNTEEKKREERAKEYDKLLSENVSSPLPNRSVKWSVLSSAWKTLEYGMLSRISSKKSVKNIIFICEYLILTWLNHTHS